MDISALSERIKSSSGLHLNFNLIHENQIKMEDCIKKIKPSFMRLFENQSDLKCFKLLNPDDPKVEITMYRDALQIAKKFYDDSIKIYDVDFKTNRLKSEGDILTNLELLNTLLNDINTLYQELEKGKAMLFEAKEDPR